MVGYFFISYLAQSFYSYYHRDPHLIAAEFLSTISSIVDVDLTNKHLFPLANLSFI